MSRIRTVIAKDRRGVELHVAEGEDPDRISAYSVFEWARSFKLADDYFDALLQGFAELIDRDDWEGANAIAETAHAHLADQDPAWAERWRSEVAG